MTKHIAPETGRVADWLCLAASPVFAIMAAITSLPTGEMPDMLCSGMHHASPLGGMGVMYLLMSLFHAPSWLRLISTGLRRISGEI